jgi:YggT family protein
MSNIGIFLVKILFDLYLYVLITRLILQLIHADYRNPLSQFTIKLTQPLLTPLQKFIPHYKNIDLAVVTLILMVEILKFTVLISLMKYHFPNISIVLLVSIADIFEKTIMIYFYAIIARVLLSWFVQIQYTPILFIINKLTDPILNRIKKVVPLIGGFDLSPLIALILLQILSVVGMEIIGAVVSKL